MKRCRNGHDLTPDNIRRWWCKRTKRIVRACLTCVRAHNRAHMRRKRAAA